MNESNSNSFFESREQYLAFRAAWKASCHNKDVHLVAAHYALYALLRGRSLDSQFSPVTNKVKMTNGQAPMGAAERAVRMIQYAGMPMIHVRDALLAPWQGATPVPGATPYGGTVSEDMLRAVIARLQDGSHATHR
ncbi:hypothetical protein JKG47_01060 [Acidithiobacillus sp. MC6.1]|nr:hypothetical protein [Acidithiobacillus sp. MC6.1]